MIRSSCRQDAAPTSLLEKQEQRRQEEEETSLASSCSSDTSQTTISSITTSSVGPPSYIISHDSGATRSGTSTRQAIQKLSPPSAKRLRSDLLNKLGIVDERLLVPPVSKFEKSVLGPRVRILKAPLKTDDDRGSISKKTKSAQKGIAEPGLLGTLGSLFKVGSLPNNAVTRSSPMDIEDASTNNEDEKDDSTRRLTFNETVSVVHIPRRDEYSERIQNHLWHSSDTLKENIIRNAVEFAADGWDWKKVLEEKDHIPCPESGELIHPVHCEIARLIRHRRGFPQETDNVTDLLNTT